MSQDKTKASKEEAQRLADLIDEARSTAPTTKWDLLDKYRVVLKRQRRAGTPVRVITEALAKLGIHASEETVRVWFQRNKTVKPSNRMQAVKPVTIKPSTAATALARKAGTSAGASGPRIARNDI
jgi:hypothetical protein